MLIQPLHKLVATPEGIFLDDVPLHKCALSTLPQRTLSHILCAAELYNEMTPKDWEPPAPHGPDDIQKHALLDINLAMASPGLLNKYSPDQPRDDWGRWIADVLGSIIPSADATEQPAPNSRLDEKPKNQTAHTGGLNGHGYVPRPGDNILLARLMFAEAADTPGAYPAVAWTTINRIGSPGFPDTLDGVVYKPRAYTSVKSKDNPNGNDPWRDAADPSTLSGPNARSYAQALSLSNAILAGKTPDPTNGATYFYSGEKPKGWFATQTNNGVLVPTGKKIGTFTFLKERARSKRPASD